MKINSFHSFFPSEIKKVLVLGSGAIKIGEAGEFDYSGSQCLKALKEEKIETVLVNPNIATIQTSPDLANKIYFLPVNPYFVSRIIEKEKPQGILLSFGGQTALNCGLSLAKEKIFSKFKVKVLGTPIKAIAETEDRKLFVDCLKRAEFLTPKSIAARTLSQAKKGIKEIGFPAILRVGFALGGLGSKVVNNQKEFKEAIVKSLSVSPQVLIEEYLGGWKEIEYEVVRDQFDNCITVCNMENLDPMGIHTGESIVVAPSQSLTDFEYQKLRSLSIKLIRHLKIVGECNIQFALHPKKFDYRIIEVNARLSRSSALASKATGYPLAFVATKLALGYSLFEIKNKITQRTKAFFEPALDYLVLKFPRWDLDKFKNVNEQIGTEMKSVGEVMAIGRNFAEVLQKAIRMLNIGQEGLFDQFFNIFSRMPKKEIKKYLKNATQRRIFALAAALERGISKKEINTLTGIDHWFINRISQMVDFYKNFKKLTKSKLKEAKILGFSDRSIAKIIGKNENQIRKLRLVNKLYPAIKQIDTVAAEFPAKTNYLYTTYTTDSDDLKKEKKKKVLILGSGPYCIGSSVEFDWCAVNASWALSKAGFSTIMVNCNPETVSTDFDIGNRLYFEELTFERIADICQKEKPDYLLLSVGGQIPNNLAPLLQKLKIKVLGTKPKNIDLAEDRNKFSRLLDRLEIKQPQWTSLINKEQAFSYAQKIGYPILVRPSYVLSGSAMFVAYNRFYLEKSLLRSFKISRQYPLVVSKFMENTREVDVDGVADNGKILIKAVSEHVENAGVHSGDATMIFPAQNISLLSLRTTRELTIKIVKALRITGPFNIQFLVKNGQALVIECNLRASRSFPFVSKITGVNFIDLAMKAMLGKKPKPINLPDLNYVGVKSPQFSFTRLKGADPILQVEMASTGEVVSLGTNLYETFLKSLLATGFVLPEKSIFLSIGIDDKIAFLETAKILAENFKLFATNGTYNFLRKVGIKSTKVYKIYEQKRPNSTDLIKNKKVDLVINFSSQRQKKTKARKWQQVVTDGYLIRRAAADFNVPLINNLQLAIMFTKALQAQKGKDFEIQPWSYYLNQTNQRRIK